MKRAYWRVAVILAVLMAGFLSLLPSVPGIAQSPLARILPDTPIRLGLDLKGGLHLTLGVDVEKTVDNSLQQTAETLSRKAEQAGLSVMKPEMEFHRITLRLAEANQRASMDAFLRRQFPQLIFTRETDTHAGGLLYRGQFTDEYANGIREMAVEQVVRTLRDRIDQFGVTEPDIRKQSGNQIQLQLPGISDPDRAIQLIGQTAQLTFHLVRDDLKPEEPLPEGVAFYPQVISKTSGTVSSSEPVRLDTAPLMTGEHIVDARPAFDASNRPCVTLHFNPRGAADLERITSQHLNRRLAIVLDGKVYTTPTIRERIVGGDASITGSFSTAEAQDLAIALRSGSLPAPVAILEERSVGPTLGQDSIEQGLWASVVGTAAVALIMPLYYGVAGFVADVMLLFTITLLFSGLAVFGATLTLPGIAGIVLTIGMSVDANVLIFERIREERRRILAVADIIKAGFERAGRSILDANITTLLAAAVLYQFGSGPVRGFAVTLSIGILASMFTAIFVSRVVFTLWAHYLPHTPLVSEGPLLSPASFRGILPAFNFVGTRYVSYGISAVLVAASVLSVLLGGLRYGVDFAGGVMVQVNFEHPLEGSVLKQHFPESGFPGLTVQQFGDEGYGWLLRYSMPPEATTEQTHAAVVKVLQQIRNNQATILRMETVGPKVGENLRNTALEALFYVMLLITVYLSGRFEQRWGTACLLAGCLGGGMFVLDVLNLAMPVRIGICLLLTFALCGFLRLRFALGALVGLLHDVIVTVGILILLGKDFDLIITAALLMLIGYSLNDTIVVYDRIRENLALAQTGKDPVNRGAVINQSLNQTLSRTLMTSITTLAACISLLLLGGDVIHDFALTMLIGVLVGTLSSIFVSAPLLMQVPAPARTLTVPLRNASGARHRKDRRHR